MAGQMTPKMVCAMTGIYFPCGGHFQGDFYFYLDGSRRRTAGLCFRRGYAAVSVDSVLFCLCCWRSLPLLYGKEVMFSECGIHRVSAAGILQHIVICRQDVFCLSGRESFCRYQLLRYAAALFRNRQFRPCRCFFRRGPFTRKQRLAQEE